MKNLLPIVALAITAASAFPFNSTEMQDDFNMLRKRQSAQVFSNCTEANVIALTFDDGPYQFHEQVSQTLINNGAKGTFFVNGNNFDCIYTESVANQLLQSFRDGNQIASHTWSHPHLNSLSADQQRSELTRVDTALEKIVGIKPAFVRPPYGEYNDQFLGIAAANGQKLVLWDFDSGDSTGSTAQQSEQAYDRVLGPHPSNLLALNHETEQSTVTTVLPYVLNKYKNAGYRFVTVAECLGQGAYVSQTSPGTRDASWNCN